MEKERAHSSEIFPIVYSLTSLRIILSISSPSPSGQKKCSIGDNVIKHPARYTVNNKNFFLYSQWKNKKLILQKFFPLCIV